MSNVWRVGDTMMCVLPWASPDNGFLVRITEFDGPNIHVTAVEPSDDPQVDNDFIVPFNALKKYHK